MYDSHFKQVAEEVAKLVRDPAGLKHFHKKIKGFDCSEAANKEARDNREKERQRHCQNIIDDERLRDKGAGPPEPDWVWGEDDYEKRDKNGKDRELSIKGYFPPSKIIIPPSTWPGDFGSVGQKSQEDLLPAAYFFLALCHDAIFYDQRSLIINEKFAEQCKFITIFRSFTHGFPDILQGHEDYLRRGLEDVQWDIKANVSPISTTKQKSTSRKKPSKRELSKWTPIQREVWDQIRERGLTQQEVALNLGCTVQNVSKHLKKAEYKAKTMSSRSIDLSSAQRIPTDKRGQEMIQASE